MENRSRLISFFLLSTLILMLSMSLQQRNRPAGEERAGEGAEVAAAPEGDATGAEPAQAATSDGVATPATPDGAQAEINAAPDEDAAPEPRAYYTLGSLDPARPEKMLVWFSNQGATVECVALNESRYGDLDQHHGYLGYLSPASQKAGCAIGAVGHGTPAASARPKEAADGVGLRAGDVIIQADKLEIGSMIDLEAWLETTRRGQEVTLHVKRGDGADAKTCVYQVTLTRRPLEVIRPERLQSSAAAPQHPLSYRTSFQQIGDRVAELSDKELANLPSLWNANWLARRTQDGQSEVLEFELLVPASSLPGSGHTGGLRVIKRFRLAPPSEAGAPFAAGYHLTYELEFRNEGTQPLEIAYRQDGPTGLPLEGWWYTTKTHPSSFGGAGVRDVVCKTFGGKHKMFTNPKIIERLKEYPNNTPTPMFVGETPQIQYVGVDAQYFVSALVAAVPVGEKVGKTEYLFADAQALPIGPVDPQRPSRTDTTFRLISQRQAVPAGGTLKQAFLVFAGPKQPEVLRQYSLEQCITYGWFPYVAKPLQWVLHTFHAIFRNYGVAIILLTVCVRGCLFPLGIQQVRNAQKMQELAPEMKRLNDLYPNDMEKRAAAQRELFRKHNYNPLAGCLPVFFQLPIFVGLYRALSVDIELRQASLLPGLRWCSNLAGPDQLLNWEGVLPDFLASPTGFLGPYLNVLPLISVVLMMIQQKMYTPPPTDEQQEMQQKMMKYMMLFMGFMFFKVPAGLCLYFITSSLWGLAERKLLPRPQMAGPSTGTSAAPRARNPKRDSGKSR